MATKQVTTCDFCPAEITLGDGETATRISIQPKTPAGIGIARDEFDLCDACTEKLHGAFPRLAESMRLVQPVPAPERQPERDPALDTVSAEQLLAIIAEKLGVRVVQVPPSLT